MKAIAAGSGTAKTAKLAECEASQSGDSAAGASPNTTNPSAAQDMGAGECPTCQGRGDHWHQSPGLPREPQPRQCDDCHGTGSLSRSTSEDAEQALFEFLCRKYVQRSDERQRAMGLQYTEAETHDLAKEIARFIANSLDRRPDVEAIREAAAATIKQYAAAFYIDCAGGGDGLMERAAEKLAEFVADACIAAIGRVEQ